MDSVFYKLKELSFKMKEEINTTIVWIPIWSFSKQDINPMVILRHVDTISCTV